MLRSLVPVLAALTALPVAVRPAAAQDPCPLGRISYVFIDNKSIFDTTDPDLDARFRWAYGVANSLHIPTREWVIRRELLFAPGSCYDPFLLEETERLLRGYDFLSRVDVFEARQDDGTWHVIVSTRDEWSTRVDIRLSTADGIALEGIRLTEHNLLGSGQALGVFFFEREVTRDYGVSYFTPQLLGTRWDLQLAAGRTRAGTFVREEVGYPFVGEVSRWGGRQSFVREDQFFNYITRDAPDGGSAHVLLPLRQKLFDMAVVRRIGRRGSMALLGGALSYQAVNYPGPIYVAPEGDFERREPAPDSLGLPVLGQRRELHNIRAFALLGHRNVWWVRRRGLDSMRGQEDVRLGGEAVLALGRSMPSLETGNDLYTMLNLYAGMQLGDLLLVGRARTDGRRDLDAALAEPEWQDLYLEAELLAYLQSALLPRQTLFLRAATSGGWNTRTPFQLTLGGLGALRGHDRERFPGGHKVVLTAENRFFIGWPLPDVVDIGGSAFVDVARMWPGDVPFGSDSGWRAAAGFGLRGSFPAGSRSVYRLDLAWPLDRGAGLGDFRFTMSIGEQRGLGTTTGDLQLVRSRSQNIGGDLFTFR